MKSLRFKHTAAVLALAVVALAASPALAWDAHDIMTREALKAMPELEAFTSIEVTPYTYGDLDKSVYNPAFQVQYKFEKIGDRVSALDILSAYAPEPDWDMDSDLKLSSMQKLTGGSQGWRHQRYTLMGGLISFGVGPERVEHFYNLAVAADKKGDLYWAFRFLARAIHYQEDLNEPLHAFPLPVSDLFFQHGLKIEAATTVATNVHYSIESYWDDRLMKGDPVLLKALSGPEITHITSVSGQAKKANQNARKKSGEIYRLVLGAWPELNTTQDARIPEAEYSRTGAMVQQVEDLAAERMAAAAADTRGLVTKFLEDIK